MSFIAEKEYQHVARVRGAFVRHKGVSKCFGKALESFYYRSSTGRPKNLMLIGQTGVGKTTIIKALEKKITPIYRNDRVEYPLLTVTVPSKPTTKNMAEQVLIAMGDEQASRGSSITKTDRIINLVNELGIKMFVFDEMQHFIDGGNKTAPNEVANWLKVVIDRTRASTLLVGTPPVEQILAVNDQIRRRFSSTMELRSFNMRNAKSAQEFAGIIRHFDRALALPNPIDVNDINLLRSIYFATNGVMDYIVKLLTEAYEIARNDSKTQITASVLEEAFTEVIWHSGVGKFNPFNSSFLGKKLDYERNMPFAA